MTYGTCKTTESDPFEGWTIDEMSDYEDWLDERQWRIERGLPLPPGKLIGRGMG